MSMLHGDQEMLGQVLTLHPHGKLHWSWGECNLSLGVLPREKGDAHPHFSPCLTQEMNIQQLTNYRKSIMNLSDGGKLYRKELEMVLCNEPPM